MADYLLDTNHISPLVTPEHSLRAQILSRLGHGDSFSIATIALSEFIFGIISLPRTKQNRAEWEHLKPGFDYYNSDRFDAEQAAELRAALCKEGWQLAALDVLIAVVALRYELVLLTTDKDFNAIPKLKIENWRDSLV